MNKLSDVEILLYIFFDFDESLMNEVGAHIGRLGWVGAVQASCAKFCHPRALEGGSRLHCTVGLLAFFASHRAWRVDDTSSSCAVSARARFFAKSDLLGSE